MFECGLPAWIETIRSGRSIIAKVVSIIELTISERLIPNIFRNAQSAQALLGETDVQERERNKAPRLLRFFLLNSLARLNHVGGGCYFQPSESLLELGWDTLGLLGTISEPDTDRDLG